MISVVPLAESHFAELRRALDVVARERRYLAIFEAPPEDVAFAFYRAMLADGQCHVALEESRVVGWCDIQGVFGAARRHLGVLGIGLVPEARGRGGGRQLMEAAIARAWERGLTRIELTVREDNHVAVALYERLGFVHEGLKRNSLWIDGRYVHSHAMALLREVAPPT